MLLYLDKLLLLKIYPLSYQLKLPLNLSYVQTHLPSLLLHQVLKVNYHSCDYRFSLCKPPEALPKSLQVPDCLAEVQVVLVLLRMGICRLVSRLLIKSDLQQVFLHFGKVFLDLPDNLAVKTFPFLTGAQC